MTTKSLSETDNFADQKTPDLATDFALQMKNAVDVQFIDTNLYQSKELRQPTLAVGGFGGQVSNNCTRLVKCINEKNT